MRYTVDNKISDEPALDWWAQEVLKRALRLIIVANSKNKNMYNRIRFKYGIQVPRKFSVALDIGKENGNEFMQKAIEKERVKVQLLLIPYLL